jgi:Na+/H+-translocating membrane pyrophosphatase
MQFAQKNVFLIAIICCAIGIILDIVFLLFPSLGNNDLRIQIISIGIAIVLALAILGFWIKREEAIDREFIGEY